MMRKCLMLLVLVASTYARAVEEMSKSVDSNTNDALCPTADNKGLGENEENSNVESCWLCNKKIAFSAYLSRNYTCLQRGQHVQFDRVLLNAGHGYSPVTGVFRAPTCGVYVFTYVISQGGQGQEIPTPIPTPSTLQPNPKSTTRTTLPTTTRPTTTRPTTTRPTTTRQTTTRPSTTTTTTQTKASTTRPTTTRPTTTRPSTTSTTTQQTTTKTTPTSRTTATTRPTPPPNGLTDIVAKPNRNGHEIIVKLLRGGTTINSAVTETGSTGTNTAVIYVRKGEAVWIEVVNGDQLLGDNENRFTSFSGFLLYKR